MLYIVKEEMINTAQLLHFSKKHYRRIYIQYQIILVPLGKLYPMVSVLDGFVIKRWALVDRGSWIRIGVLFRYTRMP